MDKETFLGLSVEAQIEEFNRLIKEHGSMTKAAKIIDIDRKTLKNRFRKDGYEFDHEAKQFVKDTNTQIEGQTSLVEPVSENKQDANIAETNNNLIDISQLENIIEDKITNLLEKYFSDKTSSKSDIEISSRCEGNVRYSSYGVYEDIAKEFHDYVKKHPRYTKVELVSQALLEYMLRHK